MSYIELNIVLERTTWNHLAIFKQIIDIEWNYKKYLKPFKCVKTND